MSINVETKMLLDGETTYEAAERIRRIRVLRRERRAPVDKLAERDRLVKLWRLSYPMHQPELCRINPNFALVHAKAFRPGMRFGNLSLLPGHVPGHLRFKFRRQAEAAPITQPAKTDEAAAQLDLFAA
jgi:hypothetical protein